MYDIGKIIFCVNKFESESICKGINFFSDGLIF